VPFAHSSHQGALDEGDAAIRSGSVRADVLRNVGVLVVVQPHTPAEDTRKQVRRRQGTEILVGGRKRLLSYGA